MKNQFDYFYYEWFFTNEDTILGKNVDELYKEYRIKSRKAGHRPYCKRTFIEEITDRLDCTIKKGVFIAE